MHSLIVHDQEGHHITLQTSNDIDDFPVILSVESVSTSGLRMNPNAPSRNHRIQISGFEPDEIFSCLNEFQIAMSEVNRSGFVAYVEGVIPQSSELPSARLNECMTGEITSWNINSHGIHHLELRGNSEDAGVRFTLRFAYDGEGRVEISGSDAAMYGAAHKTVEYPGRTPAGQPSGMRTGVNLSDALESSQVQVTAYPLAGIPYYDYGVRFASELSPISRARRHRGLTYTIEGVLLGSESCP